MEGSARGAVTTLECEAVLFDLDGVLVDSNPVVLRTWRAWARERDLDPARILEVAHGRRTAETIRLVAPDLDAEAEAAELERLEIGDLDGVRAIPGAAELLPALPRGVWAVVTSGTRRVATTRMEHVGLPLPVGLVTAEDVREGKPAPEPYLRGAELLGVDPAGCVVFEDAPSGIEAARSAGMRVVALTTTYARSDLPEVDAAAGSLAEVRAARPTGGGASLAIRVGVV